MTMEALLRQVEELQQRVRELEAELDRLASGSCARCGLQKTRVSEKLCETCMKVVGV